MYFFTKLRKDFIIYGKYRYNADIIKNILKK